jgi:hypothetical protein
MGSTDSYIVVTAEQAQEKNIRFHVDDAVRYVIRQDHWEVFSDSGDILHYAWIIVETSFL